MFNALVKNTFKDTDSENEKHLFLKYPFVYCWQIRDNEGNVATYQITLRGLLDKWRSALASLLSLLHTIIESFPPHTTPTASVHLSSCALAFALACARVRTYVHYLRCMCMLPDIASVCTITAAPHSSIVDKPFL